MRAEFIFCQHCLNGIEQFRRHDGRESVGIFLFIVIINAYVAGIAQYLVNGIGQERFTPAGKSALVQDFNDFPRNLTGGVLVKDIADSLRLVFIYDDLFIDDFISVGDTAADKVAFFPALVLSAFYLLGKLGGVRMNLWT